MAFTQQTLQVLAIAVFERGHSQFFKLAGANEPASKGNFFRAGDFQPLAMLQRRYELARLKQTVMGSVSSQA